MRDGGAHPEAAAVDEEVVRLRTVVEFHADRLGVRLPSLPVELSRVLSDSERHAEAVTLLEAVHAGRSRVLGPDHPDTLESHAELVLARLETAAPASPDWQSDLLSRWESVFGAQHPETEELRWRLRTARPAWQPRLTLTGTAAVGLTSSVEVRLERQEDVPALDLPRIEVVADCRTDAVLLPAVVEYAPGGAPAVFSFTPREPGAHKLRFTLYDHASGLALQELETVVQVPGTEERHGARTQGSD